MNTSHYVPGVCNIGPDEIAKRRTVGWIGLVVTIVLWDLFFIYHTSPAWRLFIFIPTTIAALGFIQAFSYFCANFGLRGLFNINTEAGKNDTVSQAEYRKKDRAKAISIILSSVAIGIVIAAIAFLVV